MLRDKLRDKTYFDENIDFSIETIEEYIAELKTDMSLTIESKMKYSFRIVSNLISVLHERYSRGDNIYEFKTNLDKALEYRSQQKKYADALLKTEQNNRIGWENIREDYLENWFKWLAFAYCLGMGQGYYKQVLDLMDNQGLDALFDRVSVKLGDSNREIGTTILFKKRFNKLYAIIEAEPELRPELMQAYLCAWYKLIGSPDFHLMDTDAYDGYWCWEAALITKLYNIDDTIYLNHPYYPKDLVHWNGESVNGC
jgi:hypothetical protein